MHNKLGPAHVQQQFVKHVAATYAMSAATGVQDVLAYPRHRATCVAMLPIGQSDAGHVTHCLSRPARRVFSSAVRVAQSGSGSHVTGPGPFRDRLTERRHSTNLVKLTRRGSKDCDVTREAGPAFMTKVQGWSGDPQRLHSPGLRDAPPGRQTQQLPESTISAAHPQQWLGQQVWGSTPTSDGMVP